jgi:arginase family enzyme
MVKEDWRGYLVARENARKQVLEGYGKIFQGLGIDDVVRICEENISPEENARKVAEFVRTSNKKPLVIGLGHHLIAYVTNDLIDHVYFDAHIDDYRNAGFHCGSFINFMQGRHFCIGANKFDFQHHKEGNAILLNFEELETIARFSFRRRIFLSYDTDVFHPSVTTALSEVACAGGFAGRMFPQQVKDLSVRIVEGRDLVGLAVVEYSPYDEDYKTADIFVDLLKPLL